MSFNLVFCRKTKGAGIVVFKCGRRMGRYKICRVVFEGGVILKNVLSIYFMELIPQKTSTSLSIRALESWEAWAEGKVILQARNPMLHKYEVD